MDAVLRRQLVRVHRMEKLLSQMSSGQHRQVSSIPAEEIADQRGVWIRAVVGKTTRDLAGASGFGWLPEQAIEVWLWAVAHPALGISCNPENGVWGRYPNPYPIPPHLREDIQWWCRELAVDSSAGAAPENPLTEGA